MSATVFYSWQSDVMAAACRSFILTALESAAAGIAKDETIGVEPVIDRDTQDVPGSPDIGATIFSKIEKATAFVADVTIVGTTLGGKHTPNPNVLIELGYALKALGPERIILVQNVALGGPELLPFDLRQKRVVRYSSPVEATERAGDRRGLQGVLEAALRAILSIPSMSAAPPEVELSLSYEKMGGSTSDCHLYNLVTILKNTSKRRIEDWELEIDFPTPLMDSTNYGIKVADRSNEKRSVFVVDGRKLEPLRPAQERPVRLGYQVTDKIFWNRKDLFDEKVRVHAMVDGRVVAEIVRPIRELQNF